MKLTTVLAIMVCCLVMTISMEDFVHALTVPDETEEINLRSQDRKEQLLGGEKDRKLRCSPPSGGSDRPYCHGG